MTVVELLVSMAILGLLMALLLPAVQQARETARTVQCKNNLHQIGVATHAHCESHGHLPSAYFPLQKLLPNIGMTALAKVLESYLTPTPSTDTSAGPALYICPSDSEATTSARRISYLLNDGSAILPKNGVRIYEGSIPTRLRDISDGLSTTVMFAERLVWDLQPLYTPDVEARRSPLRYEWKTSQDFLPGQELQLAEYCLNPANRATATRLGQYASDQLGSIEARYNHMVPPNNWSFHILGNPGIGAFPPSSLHSGGVHVLMADGSARFVATTVDLKVWRAIGSRNGNEPIGEF